HGWHYNYPPFLAILLTPLADAPPGADRTCLLPFGVSVLLWYLFCLLCLIAAVHLLVKALQAGEPSPFRVDAGRRRLTQLLPAAVFGPQRAVAHYRELAGAVLGPGLGAADDASRREELLSHRDNFSQSFVALLHQLRYPDRDSRPAEPEPGLRVAHWALAAG